MRRLRLAVASFTLGICCTQFVFASGASAASSVPRAGTSAAVAAAPETVPGSVLGAFTGYANVAGVEAVGNVIGTPLTFASDYLTYNQGWSGMTSAYLESRWSGSGFRMVYGLPMFPQTCAIGSATCWNAGAAGKYDSYFSTIAKNLVSYGQGNAILRIGWEFNVPGEYSWYAAGYASQFVAYWRNIVTTMRAVSGANFVFDWNPNIGSAIPDLSSYYPGNSYVGAVGFDVYDIGWQVYPGAQELWQGYLTETDGLNWLASFAAANGEPLSFPEWGLGWTAQPPGSGAVGGGDDAYFVNQIAAFISSHTFIEAGIFDASGQFPDASVNPQATAALISDFG